MAFKVLVMSGILNKNGKKKKEKKGKREEI